MPLPLITSIAVVACTLGHVHCVNTLCMYIHIYIVGHMYIVYACYVDLYLYL